MSSKQSTIILNCLLLVILVAGVYSRILDHGFLNLDDQSYVTQNPNIATGLNLRNIGWAFTSFYSSNWHPLTWISHMADIQFYGMNPRGHHLTNLIIHCVTSLLLLLFLHRHTGSIWRSSFVATMFALHPLHVESVAWIAERKDLLCAFFWMLTLLAYGEYAASGKRRFYLFALLSFLLGLMSKPMIVTLPVILLLLDIWPLARFSCRSGNITKPAGLVTLAIEKLPFLLLSLVSCVITVKAQKAEGSFAYLRELPFGIRFENALVSYGNYIVNTLWPHDLAVYYPYPSAIPAWKFILASAVLFLLSAGAWLLRRHSYLLTGWLWYLVTLLPVIGFVQVGNQAMADRYTYMPIIGLFICIAWGAVDLARSRAQGREILATGAVILVIAACSLTWRQLAYWQDSITLFRHTLQVTKENAFIHYNLGLTLHIDGDLDGAIREYGKTVSITPNDRDAHNALGIALQEKGLLGEALREYMLALRIDPNDPSTRNNLGLLYLQRGEIDAAIREFQTCLSINPRNANAAENLMRAHEAKKGMNGAGQ